MQKAEEDAKFNFNKRRGIAQEKREAKQERDEAEKYQQLKDDLADKQAKLFLFQLYHTERNIQLFDNQIQEQRRIVEALRQRKCRADDIVAVKLKDQKKTARDVHKTEQKALDVEKKVAKQKPTFVTAKQQVAHVVAKLDTCRKVHLVAERQAKSSREQIDEVQRQHRDLDDKRKEYSAQLARKSQTLELHLNDDQVAEYYQLLKQVGKRCTTIQTDLDDVQQEQDTDKNSSDYERTRLKQHGDKLKTKKAELDMHEQRVKVLAEKITDKNEAIVDEKQTLVRLETDVKASKQRLEEVVIEMGDVTKQLADAHGDSNETERERKRTELVDNLKRIFVGKVYGRLVDVCKPAHRRYQIAVTKVLQKHMSSIICDTWQTGRDCIAYVKEQRCDPETFLPINYLDVRPLSEKLR